ncbi:unnamed protein product [Rotaria magnacalcarata]|uniref:C-type lectin domain-containing protein n=1 Tax=Rotaria magnacalcarata TaxID=392030 RepID=A0A8S2KBT9_9BILA|nr:unnamed protein product [Rotaria magnacalcarata]
MIVHLSLVFISFVAFSNSQANTIHKACSTGGSTCGAGQACINDICQCDPTHRRFWTGEQHQCRVCPPGYIRARKRRIYFLVVDALCSFSATRCYKYFKEYKNQSEARAVCRKDQADLFTWRDNTDENELLKASAAEWNYNYENVQNQFYSWSGGMVYHGQGGRAEYEITWFDPKGPTVPHPDTGDQLTDRYCNAMTKTNYHGDPEPTRQTRNGERENCVTIVFLPQPKSRGLIYTICELNFNKITPHPIDYSIGPQFVTMGDFNNDTWLDIAIANYAADNITLFFGNINNTVPIQIVYPTGSGSGSYMVAVGDFNKR